VQHYFRCQFAPKFSAPPGRRVAESSGPGKGMPGVVQKAFGEVQITETGGMIDMMAVRLSSNLRM
jgi:hypothetical protein